MAPKKVLVTGSAGLVGSDVCLDLAEQGYQIVGIDNCLRGKLLNDPSANPRGNLQRLSHLIPEEQYLHLPLDIRDEEIHDHLEKLGPDLAGIVHCAAQTSHEGEMKTDFEINAFATVRLLHLWKTFAPQAKFIYLSTIKIYGDTPNYLMYKVEGDRMEPREKRDYLDPKRGFNENTPVGQGVSCFFSRSKLAADLYVQEFRHQYGLESFVLRPSCITGPHQLGTQAHGMLGYMMKCAYLKKPYTIFGYDGLQVRDQLYSDDVAYAIRCILGWLPGIPERVFNLGGGYSMSVSMNEAVKLCERITGNKMTILKGVNRIGDHPWWVTDCRLFESLEPSWIDRLTGQSVDMILNDIMEARHEVWDRESRQ